jgi:hypothetical protein
MLWMLRRSMAGSLENELPSSVEEGMPGPTATAGVVGVPCSSATNHRDSGAEHQGGGSHVQNPPEVHPCPRGDGVFIERGAA